jgi:hypothetical protein
MGNRLPGAAMSDLNQSQPPGPGNNPPQWCPCRLIALLIVLVGVALLVHSL